jgi:hypothetical protein
MPISCGADSPPDYGERRASMWIRYFDVHGQLLFSSAIPASPDDGRLSFFGLVFDEARIARVQITSGYVAPGPMMRRHTTSS